MILVEENTINWNDLIFEPRRTKGQQLYSKESLTNYISFGNIWYPINHDNLNNGTDCELFEFIQSQSQFKFYFLHIACTFRPKQSEPFEKAWLEVNLSRSNSIDDQKPIAWSLKPQKTIEPDPKQYSKSVEVGASLKFLEASIKETRTVNKSEIFIQGLKELESEPFWEIKSTNTNKIDGTLHFYMIIRGFQDTSTIAKLKLTATVNRKKYGLLSYSALYEKNPSLLLELT